MPKTGTYSPSLAENVFDLFSADHTVLNVENEVKLGHWKEHSSGWLQSQPTKSKEADDTVECFERFMPPLQMGELHTDNFDVDV